LKSKQRTEKGFLHGSHSECYADGHIELDSSSGIVVAEIRKEASQKAWKMMCFCVKQKVMGLHEVVQIFKFFGWKGRTRGPIFAAVKESEVMNRSFNFSNASQVILH
jgi:hypothetical protein